MCVSGPRGRKTVMEITGERVGPTGRKREGQVCEDPLENRVDAQ